MDYQKKSLKFDVNYRTFFEKLAKFQLKLLGIILSQLMVVSCPEMAATIDGAPNMVAIPAVTPIIKPQETLPVKKPIPVAIIANDAKVFPALPVTTFKA
jgi:hypothetical protein